MSADVGDPGRPLTASELSGAFESHHAEAIGSMARSAGGIGALMQELGSGALARAKDYLFAWVVAHYDVRPKGPQAIA